MITVQETTVLWIQWYPSYWSLMMEAGTVSSMNSILTWLTVVSSLYYYIQLQGNIKKYVYTHQIKTFWDGIWDVHWTGLTTGWHPMAGSFGHYWIFGFHSTHIAKWFQESVDWAGTGNKERWRQPCLEYLNILCRLVIVTCFPIKTDSYI